MDETTHRAEAQLYNTNLDYTLKELQKKVSEHEEELRKVKFMTHSLMFCRPADQFIVTIELKH